MKIQTSAYEVGARFIGQAEVEGTVSNPLILAMLRLGLARVARDSQGLGQGPLKRPALVQTQADHVSADASAPSPAIGGVGYSVVGQSERGARVGYLLGLVGPTAVAGLVIAIGIWVSVQGMGRAGLESHVRQEVLERVNPSLADADSAPAVVGVLGSVGIQAAALHGTPTAVLGGVRAPVSAVDPASDLAVSTAAGNLHSISQGGYLGVGGRAAIAKADPIPPGNVVALNDQARETLAGKVGACSRHSSIIPVVTA